MTRAAFPPVLLAGACVAFFARYYGKFGDIVVDCFRDATIPLRILSGQALYRDFHYEYGPIAPYLTTLLYAVFGPDLWVLQSAGLVAAILTSWLVYALCRISLGRVVSLTTAMVFVVVFAFGNYQQLTTYNFIFPYTCSATFGVVLLLALQLAGWRLLQGRSGAPLLAGVLWGLCLLTKMEVAASATAFVLVLAAGLVLRARAGEHGAEEMSRLRGLAAGLALVLIPFALALVRVSGQVGAPDLLPLVLRNTHGRMAQAMFGLDDLGANLRKTLVTALVYAAVMGLGLALERGLDALRAGLAARRASPAANAAGTAVAFALAATAGVLGVLTFGFINTFMVLPLATAGAAAFAAASLVRSRGALPAYPLHLLALSASAAVLFGRKLFRPNATHYGFYMLVPGLVVMAVVIFDLVPRALARKPRAVYATGLAAVLLSSAAFHALLAARYYGRKSERLVTARGTVALPPEEYGPMRGLLAFLGSVPDGPLRIVPVPEGLSVNYFLGSPPITYDNSCVPDLMNAPGREERLIRDIQTKGVRYVVVLTRWTDEFGFPAAGVDYMRATFALLLTAFEPRAAFGPPPFNPERRFGIALLERRAPPPALTKIHRERTDGP